MKDFSKENIIDKWLKENGNPKIEKQVEDEYKEIMEKQKTPLAKVIKRLDKIKKNLTNKSQVSDLQNIIDDIKSLLPTEREAFEKAYKHTFYDLDSMEANSYAKTRFENNYTQS
jgi:uncharacterized HAD superfamily protein